MRQTLDEVLLKGFHADRMIDKYVRANPKWSADERKLFAESIYDILRHKRKIEFAAESEEILLLVATYFIHHGYGLPPRAEFSELDKNKISENMKKSKNNAVEYSLPDWLDHLGAEEFGARWPKLAAALVGEPALYLRTNTLKTQKAALAAALKKESIVADDKFKGDIATPDALEIKDKKNVFVSAPYKQGQFEVQDIGSQFISPLLQVEPNMQVIDACAGSGGKTLHLAALMKNQGQITAMDIKGYKLKDLQLRAEKAGCKILKTQLIDSNKVIKRFENTADRLLLDVPCSGLGVLKRNPDSKWKMQPEQIEELIQTQRHILTEYSEMCKKDGLMVYATCSLLKKENEEQVKWFLSSQAGAKWQLLSEHRVWPDINNSDGFFAAVFKRK